MGNGGESSSPSPLHKRTRTDDSDPISISPGQADLASTRSNFQRSSAPKPFSYAATLIQPLGARNFNSEVMTCDFSIEDDDFQVSKGVKGPKFQFSNKVEEKLNLEWNSAVIVKLMGRPNTANAYKFMFDSLNRKWVTKGPWQLVDLPNGFFAVKFQLVEDMDYALCNGPWIIAGQTLVVQKWRPDFDPLVDKISRMAVWVRILELPVKYYKDLALYRIGGLLGTVVKVDKVTLGQTRGKFCRLCVEINLDEPLKPFLEWGDHSFGVVYEGISTICFNCGVYGHVRDHCPYTLESPNSTTKVSDDGANAAHMAEDHIMGTELPVPRTEPVVEKLGNRDASVKTNTNIGPWMVMSYKKNKKPFNGPLSETKKFPSGSRFAPLQDEFEAPADPLSKGVESVAKKHSGPTIVQLWQRVQEKVKEGYPKNSTSETSLPQKTATTGRSKSTMFSAPLKDISNVNTGSVGTKPAKKVGVMAKTRSTTNVTTIPFPIVCELPSIDSEAHPSNSTDARYGHSPPEEPGMDTEDNPPDPADHEHMVDNAEYSAEKEANSDDDLSSSNEEDMVVC